MGRVEGLHVVTGAFGYTGRWIAHHLVEQGAEVRTLTNSVGRDYPFDGKVEVHRYDFDNHEKLVDSLRGPVGCLGRVGHTKMNYFTNSCFLGSKK